MAESHEDLVSQFMGITSASLQDAQQFLSNSSWDLQSAVTEFYNPPEEEEEEEEEEEAEDPPQPSHPASSSVPSAPQQIPTSSNMPPKPSQPKKKFATIGDLSAGSGRHAGHGHDDDDDDDDDDEKDQNLFAGGEKSGLAVQNPDELKRKIIERARKNMARPGGDAPRPERSRFTGTAHTLGGDDVPSETIPDPTASQPGPSEPVIRHLHFWADGFSVDDGPLFRFDDPRNAEVLAQIKQGRAPMYILNVTPNQEVDVHVQQHNKENYKPPKKKYKPFEGGGQRLGSPTPGGESASVPIAQQPAAPAPASGTGTEEQAPTVGVNDNEPTLSLQIRLGDGTRLVSRFNASHTIGDVYDYVNAASAASRAREWVLMTTFPRKELTEKRQALSDLAEFKRGGVMVQKWL